MNSGLKILLLLALLGGAAYLVFSGASGKDSPTLTPAGQPEQPIDGQPQDPVEPATAENPPPDQNRQIVRAPVDDTPASAEDAPQGVRGRLVDSRGAPVAGARVFLFEGHGANLFEAMLRAQRGVLNPPVASTESEPDGSFQLGVRALKLGKTWELRATSEFHADVVRPNLTVFEEQWHDAGAIEMANGLIVVGRVLSLGSGAPVEGATVVLKPANQTMVMAPTPGREQGITCKTDRGGNYRFENATPGILTVSAFAPEHARVERANQNVRPDVENRFDFELPPGKSIAGVVTDGEGTAITNARVQVLAISSKNPISVDTFTDRDGRFEALGLVDGPYQVLVTALGFVRADDKPVPAGEVEWHIVLETQGTARVKVLSRSGKLIPQYTVVVKSYIVQQDTYGNMMHIPMIEVGPRDLDSDKYFEVGGLDPASYALEIHAKGYAKGYSKPFDITVGGTEPELQVELSEGGAIAGQVIGQDGTPIGSVTIETLPNEYEDNALAVMFKTMIPYKISKSAIRTGRDGTFKLPRLAPGTYQLQLAHPEHYTIFQKGIVVEEGRTTTLQPIRMMSGTMMFGSVTLDGAAGPQIKVQVSAVPDPTGQTRNTFNAVAVTDDQGRFVLPKRLPPGTYQASAGRQSNPFQMVVDYQQTKQEFAVGAGQAQHRIHFRIQSQ